MNASKSKQLEFNQKVEEVTAMINECYHEAVDIFDNYGSLLFEDDGIVWGELTFVPYDNELKPVTKLMVNQTGKLAYFANHPNLRDEELDYTLPESQNRYQSLLFLINDLAVIKDMFRPAIKDKELRNELMMADRGECTYASPWYLLLNPRKEVVEWALKFFDYKSSKDCSSGYDLAMQCQTNLEAKQLIKEKLGSIKVSD